MRHTDWMIAFVWMMLLVCLLALVTAGCTRHEAVAVRDGGAAEYSTIAALHETGMARTCSLNGGVCHNSREYPDLHTLSNLIGLIDQPCNLGATKREDVRDACETEGDRLVIPSLGVDNEITFVAVQPEEAETAALTAVTVELDTPAAAASGAVAYDVEVRRGEMRFTLSDAGVSATIGDDGRVVLDLSFAEDSARGFLDDRRYPWTSRMVRVSDPNRNGVRGRRPMALIRPGEPLESYLVIRLFDESQGELMPRQCRTWNDRATRALACWIAGLRRGPDGKVANAHDPIDYASCAVQLPAGRCSEASGTLSPVEAIFNRSCGGSRCHVGRAEPAAQLDLSPGRARASLVGIGSVEVSGMKRVEPGRPDDSYLLCKLVPECARRKFDRMPASGPPLPDAEIATIRDWIRDGAP